MLDLNKIRESRSISIKPTRKTLSSLISESYNLLYDCEDKRLKKMIESHLKDIREANQDNLQVLSQNLQTLVFLNEASKHGRPIREDEELDDPRLETDDATIDQLTAVNPQQDEEPEFDAPKADPDEVEKFAENSRGKTFYKALTKATSLNESTKRFSLIESLSVYKAANSAMTQMAIELEHNNKFQETFNVLTKVLGRATHSILESIYNKKPIDEHAMETVSRFSKALREDDQDDINDFIDWVDNEYPEEGESSDDVCPDCGQNPCVCEDEIEIPDDLTPEQAVDVITDIITDIYPDLVVDAVDEEGEQTEEQTAEEVLDTVTDEEAEDLKQYLALLRAGDEETPEDAEPTEEEIDALEEHLIRRRKMKDSKKVSVGKSHRKNEEYYKVKDISKAIGLEEIPSVSEALGSNFSDLLVCSEDMIPDFESFEKSLISRSKKIRQLDAPRGVAATLYSLNDKLWVSVGEYGHYSIYTTRDNASMLESRKREASDPLTTGTEGEEVDSDVPDPDKPNDAPGKDVLKENKNRKSIRSKK